MSGASRNKTVTLARVLAVSAEKFLSRRFEEVSINDIAETAHCSNNTIYDVFRTKEDLYRGAICYAAKRLNVPSPKVDRSKDPLTSIVERAEAWLDFANDPVTRELFLTIAGHSQKLNALMAGAETDPTVHWDAFKEDAHRCMEAGVFRKLDGDTIVSHIISGTIYLNIVLHAIFDKRFTVTRRESICRAFAPLVTEYGSELLARLLRADDAPQELAVPAES